LWSGHFWWETVEEIVEREPAGPCYLNEMPADLLEIVEVVVYAFLGWRYIFSPTYRKQTHKRWKSESRLTIFFEILYGVFGIGLTLLPFWFLVDALRR
jgi:uncharacterized membrane protein YfcA